MLDVQRERNKQKLQMVGLFLQLTKVAISAIGLVKGKGRDRCHCSGSLTYVQTVEHWVHVQNVLIAIAMVRATPNVQYYYNITHIMTTTEEQIYKIC